MYRLLFPDNLIVMLTKPSIPFNVGHTITYGELQREFTVTKIHHVIEIIDDISQQTCVDVTLS